MHRQNPKIHAPHCELFQVYSKNCLPLSSRELSVASDGDETNRHSTPKHVNPCTEAASSPGDNGIGNLRGDLQ